MRVGWKNLLEINKRAARLLESLEYLQLQFGAIPNKFKQFTSQKVPVFIILPLILSTLVFQINSTVNLQPLEWQGCKNVFRFFDFTLQFARALLVLISRAGGSGCIFS